MSWFKIEFNTTIYWYRNFLRLLGYWPGDNLKGWRKYLSYFHTGFSYSFILGIYIITQIVDLYQVRGDIVLMAANCFILFTNICQTIKMINIVIRCGRIDNIINELDQLAKNSFAPDKEKILKKYALIAYHDIIQFCCLTTSVLVSWFGGKLITNINTHSNELPLNAWYPYNTDEKLAFYLTYLHQCIALCFAAYLNTTKDCLVTSLINSVTCQFELIKNTIIHIADDVYEYEEDCNSLTRQIENDRYEKLKLCIIHHQKTLMLIKEVERCFSIPTFAQFNVSLVIICTTAIQLAMTIDNSLTQFFGILTYMVTMMFQVFLYCWHGNEIMISSKDLITSAYCCNWYKCSSRFKSTLRLMMTRCTKPVVLNAGGFTNLQIATFINIMKVSYSFFTILKQLIDNSD